MGATRGHHGKKTTPWRRCDAVGQVLLGNLADPFVGAKLPVASFSRKNKNKRSATVGGQQEDLGAGSA